MILPRYFVLVLISLRTEAFSQKGVFNDGKGGVKAESNERSNELVSCFGLLVSSLWEVFFQQCRGTFFLLIHVMAVISDPLY